MQKQFMNKQSMQKQKGLTLVSWIVIIAFIGFHFMVAIRVVPVFAEDHTIKGIWKKMEMDTAMIGLSPRKIKKYIAKKMRMNNVHRFDMDLVIIKKSKGAYTITTEYEPRGKIIGPLDFIVTFKHEAQVRTK